MHKNSIFLFILVQKIAVCWINMHENFKILIELVQRVCVSQKIYTKMGVNSATFAFLILKNRRFYYD